jgi:S-adenosylmethionine:tRNA ribosyltransferase-isomerase
MDHNAMRVSDYDYDLPPHLIAQTPIEPRDSARLLVLDRATSGVSHHIFRDLPDLLRPGDILVANDSRVLPARLYGRRGGSGGAVEVLLLREDDEAGPDVWIALVRPGRRIRPGETLLLDGRPPETAGVSPPAAAPANDRDRSVVSTGSAGAGPLTVQPANGGDEIDSQGPNAFEADVSRQDAGAPSERPLLTATVLDSLEGGERRLRLHAAEGTVRAAIHRVGVTPLPPYIHAPLRDPERYQTVYARDEGSVAAPTAGLHFTPDTLWRLQERGVALRHVTLHVGAGTFKPMAGEEVSAHVMHAEWAELDAATAGALNAARAEGRRVIAVGTTSVRVLESAATPEGLRAYAGWTDIFITPGHTFRAVDGLITNFHLPRSTLLLLVGAFASKELIDKAYAEAIAEEYRFYSFGDAMLML